MGVHVCECVVCAHVGVGAHVCINTPCVYVSACVHCTRAGWQRVTRHSTLPDIRKGKRAAGSSEPCFERFFLLQAKLCLSADFAGGPGGDVYCTLVRPDGWFPVGFSTVLRGMVCRTIQLSTVFILVPKPLAKATDNQ